MISEEQLAEWEQLANKATPGPWYAHKGPDYDCIHNKERVTTETPMALVGSQHKDSKFIAAAREAVPALIARVRELEKEALWLANRLEQEGIEVMQELQTAEMWREEAREATEKECCNTNLNNLETSHARI